jgi:hypothetical protein
MKSIRWIEQHQMHGRVIALLSGGLVVSCGVRYQAVADLGCEQ